MTQGTRRCDSRKWHVVRVVSSGCATHPCYASMHPSMRTCAHALIQAVAAGSAPGAASRRCAYTARRCAAHLATKGHAVRKVQRWCCASCQHGHNELLALRNYHQLTRVVIPGLGPEPAASDTCRVSKHYSKCSRRMCTQRISSAACVDVQHARSTPESERVRHFHASSHLAGLALPARCRAAAYAEERRVR